MDVLNSLTNFVRFDHIIHLEICSVLFQKTTRKKQDPPNIQVRLDPKKTRTKSPQLNSQIPTAGIPQRSRVRGRDTPPVSGPKPN